MIKPEHFIPNNKAKEKGGKENSLMQEKEETFRGIKVTR